MFGGDAGRVDLGRYAGPSELTGGVVPTTGVTSGIPTPGIPTPRTTPVPGVPNLTFTPGQPQYFSNIPGAMLPGTLPSNINPLQAYKGPYAIDQLAMNPNLSPGILGGYQALGYYTDRLGNRILAPGGGLMRFAEGGEASKDDSAKAELEKLLAAVPAQQETQVNVSPNARSVKRTTTKSASTDRGKAMSFDLESLTEARGSRTKDQGSAAERLALLMESLKEGTREAQDTARGLSRQTFNKPRFDRAGLGRAGSLMVRRFEEGGEAITPLGNLQVRTYRESLRPENLTRPITEKNLSAKELDKLRQLIELAKARPALSEKTGKPLPGVVGYEHHDLYKQKYGPMGAVPGPDTDINVTESANLRNTLGQFTFKEMPDGSVQVIDNYDFTGDVGETINPLIRYANYKGVNRPVRIMLPPQKKRK